MKKKFWTIVFAEDMVDINAPTITKAIDLAAKTLKRNVSDVMEAYESDRDTQEKEPTTVTLYLFFDMNNPVDMERCARVVDAIR